MSSMINIIRLLTTISLYALHVCLHLGTFTCLVYNVLNKTDVASGCAISFKLH